MTAERMWGLSGLYGMLSTWNSDSLFVGLKNEGEDRKDAVIAFGDNPSDSFRIMFALPGNPPPEPLEFIRITGRGNVGIGTTNPDASSNLNVEGRTKTQELLIGTEMFLNQYSWELLGTSFHRMELKV